MIVDPDNRSEHGLAHVIPPQSLTRSEFIDEVWALLLARELGQTTEEPEWLDDPILSQITITSPRLAAPFRHLNADRPWVEQIKPFNFILVAHLAPLGHPDGADPQRFRLITTYTTDLSAWRDLEWRNIYDPAGPTYQLTTKRHDADTGGPRPNRVAECQTYRTMLHAYQRHPEAKYADTDRRPCSTSTRGQLTRRSIRPARIRTIGKETNELEQVQVGLYGDVLDLVAEYDATDVELRDALKILEWQSGRELASVLRVDRRTVDRLRAGSTPRSELRQRIIKFDDSARTPGGLC